MNPLTKEPISGSTGSEAGYISSKDPYGVSVNDEQRAKVNSMCLSLTIQEPVIRHSDPEISWSEKVNIAAVSTEKTNLFRILKVRVKYAERHRSHASRLQGERLININLLLFRNETENIPSFFAFWSTLNVCTVIQRLPADKGDKTLSQLLRH